MLTSRNRTIIVLITVQNLTKTTYFCTLVPIFVKNSSNCSVRFSEPILKKLILKKKKGKVDRPKIKRKLPLQYLNLSVSDLSVTQDIRKVTCMIYAADMACCHPKFCLYEKLIPRQTNGMLWGLVCLFVSVSVFSFPPKKTSLLYILLQFLPQYLVRRQPLYAIGNSMAYLSMRGVEEGIHQSLIN